MEVADVLIAGGGPTGLMLAGCVARHGLSVCVLERDAAPRPNATAIGVSIPSLEILRTLGLADDVVRRGVSVRRLVFHGPSRILGDLDFAALDSEYEFVLSIPQDRVAAILEQDLARFPRARIVRGCEVTGFRSDADGIVLKAHQASQEVEFRGRYAVACDSGRSCLREAAGIAFEGAPYGDTFVMGDFEDRTGWGPEAHIFFTPHGSVESFPVPDGLRRYVLPSPALDPGSAGNYLRAHVLQRSGVDLAGSEAGWSLPFSVRHYLAQRYRAGRLLLAGDAAHLMSPIVGQNMNTGLADAELLGLAFRRVLLEGQDPARWFSLYERVRRRAAQVATFRAWVMMRLGTSGGRLWSPARNGLVRAALGSRMRRPLAQLFSMVSIPSRNLGHMTAQDAPTP
jgi:2-polyprenyl-6-methoxyphenol hydroxylase-like FAD-dependent oxidoreductase